jgi:hypothetical protein
MRALVFTVAVVVFVVLASCAGTSVRELILVATRLDSNHLVVVANVRSDDSVTLPRYLKTQMCARAKRADGDTLDILFEYDEKWRTLGLDSGTSNVVAQAAGQVSRREYVEVLAFIEGYNSDVGYLRMHLLGIDEPIVLRVGAHKVLYPRRDSISGVFIGGYGKKP